MTNLTIKSGPFSLKRLSFDPFNNQNPFFLTNFIYHWAYLTFKIQLELLPGPHIATISLNYCLVVALLSFHATVYQKATF